MKKDLSKLTELQRKVTQENYTEPPFRNAYYDNFKKGLYVDIIDGTSLFLSKDKFDAHCGWPSFSKPVDTSIINEVLDFSHFMKRTEVRSKKADSHLGHVFNDGPEEMGGLRYCINSASLRFIPYEDLKKEGYEDYIKLLDE